MAKANEPVQDAVKAYFELALGLTEASKKKAEKTVKRVARDVLGKSGATASQLQSMAEDVISTGLANREAVVNLVQAELERALGKVGLVKAEEVDALTARIDELERQLASASGAAKPAVSKAALAEASAASTPVAAKKTVAKKTVAKKTVAKKAVAEPVAAKVTTPPAKKSTAGAGATPAAAKSTAGAVVESAPVAKTAPTKAAATKTAPTKVAKAAPAVTKAAPAKKASVSKVAAKKASVAGATTEPVAAGVVEPPAPAPAPIEQEIAAASTSVAPALFSDAGAADVPAAVKKAPGKRVAKKAPAKKASRS